MDVNLFWLFVCIYFNRIVAVTGLVRDEIIFRVHRKHTIVRKCAMEIMHNHTFVGGRIRDVEGHCDQLTTYPEIESMKQGHGYFEKPELGYKNIDISFPGPLTTGSQLEFRVIRTPPNVYNFHMKRHQGMRSKVDDGKIFNVRIVGTVKDERSTIEFEVYGAPQSEMVEIPFDWQKLCPLDECKILVVVEDGQIKLLANDQRIPSSSLIVPTSALRVVRHATISGVYGSATFKRFEFRK